VRKKRRKKQEKKDVESLQHTNIPKRNKGIIASIAILLAILIISLPVISESIIKFTDSTGSEIDSLQSFELKGLVYLPLDKVCRIFDGQLQRYEPLIGRVTIQIKGKSAIFFVGQKVVNAKGLNPSEIILSNPPLLISEKLMVPMDFLFNVVANLAEVGIKFDRIRGQVRVENIGNVGEKFETTKPKYSDFTSKSQSKKKRSLIIDPGHGGKDFGAKSASGISEKEINLRLAKLISQNVSQFDLEVYLTRDDDKLLLPIERADFANIHHGEAFISVHSVFTVFTGSSKPRPSESSDPSSSPRFSFRRGAIYVNSSIFSQPESNGPVSSVSLVSPVKRLVQSEFYEESWILAKIAKDELEAQGFDIQRISEAPLAGIKDVYMPAILVEISYPISSMSPDFGAQNLESEVLQLSAEALSQATAKFFKR
jgi:N-acetylmuramoyl-L-alanine amidase